MNQRIQEEALDLIDQMLKLNPESRIDTEKALQHPYLIDSA